MSRALAQRMAPLRQGMQADVQAVRACRLAGGGWASPAKLTKVGHNDGPCGRLAEQLWHPHFTAAAAAAACRCCCCCATAADLAGLAGHQGRPQEQQRRANQAKNVEERAPAKVL